MNNTPNNKLGPIEIVLLGFPENRFKGEIMEALGDLVKNDIIRIIDILLIRKDEDGEIKVLEMNDLESDDFEVFDFVVSDVTGLLSEKDAKELSKKMKNNSSAAIMLFEHTWAIDLAEAVMRAGGSVIVSERIPKSIVEEMAATSGRRK